MILLLLPPSSRQPIRADLLLLQLKETLGKNKNFQSLIADAGEELLAVIEQSLHLVIGLIREHHHRLQKRISQHLVSIFA